MRIYKGTEEQRSVRCHCSVCLTCRRRGEVTSQRLLPQFIYFFYLNLTSEALKAKIDVNCQSKSKALVAKEIERLPLRGCCRSSSIAKLSSQIKTFDKSWVALSLLVVASRPVPHRWHPHSSSLYDIWDHTNHSWCMCGGIWWCLEHVWWCLEHVWWCLEFVWWC